MDGADLEDLLLLFALTQQCPAANPDRYFRNSGVIYGENHRVLRAQQLQKKGNQVDPARTTGESDPVRHIAKEVGMTETIGSGLEPGSWSHAQRLENVLPSRRVSSVQAAIANGASTLCKSRFGSIAMAREEQGRATVEARLLSGKAATLLGPIRKRFSCLSPRARR